MRNWDLGPGAVPRDGAKGISNSSTRRTTRSHCAQPLVFEDQSCVLVRQLRDSAVLLGQFRAKRARLPLQIANPRVLCVAALGERLAELSSDRLSNVWPTRPTLRAYNLGWLGNEYLKVVEEVLLLIQSYGGGAITL